MEDEKKVASVVDSSYIPAKLCGARGLLYSFLFGILAGALVVCFSDMPHGDLWSLSSLSSGAFGHWMFTTSLVVLFSSKRLISAANAFIYVGEMFFITGMYKYLRTFFNGYSIYENWKDLLLYSTLDSLLYGLIYGAICALLALVLWSGRKNNWFGKVMLAAPALFIAIEAVSMFWSVFANQTMLFQAILDTACLAVYLFVFGKAIVRRPERKQAA